MASNGLFLSWKKSFYVNAKTFLSQNFYFVKRSPSWDQWKIILSKNFYIKYDKNGLLLFWTEPLKSVKRTKPLHVKSLNFSFLYTLVFWNYFLLVGINEWKYKEKYFYIFKDKKKKIPQFSILSRLLKNQTRNMLN